MSSGDSGRGTDPPASVASGGADSKVRAAAKPFASLVRDQRSIDLLSVYRNYSASLKASLSDKHNAAVLHRLTASATQYPITELRVRFPISDAIFRLIDALKHPSEPWRHIHLVLPPHAPTEQFKAALKDLATLAPNHFSTVHIRAEGMSISGDYVAVLGSARDRFTLSGCDFHPSASSKLASVWAGLSGLHLPNSSLCKLSLYEEL
jgi:hypothetical protein